MRSLGNKDDHSYGTYSNPNVAYTHYWADATNVLQDLSSFRALYITYSNCVWSAKYSGNNNDNQHEGENKDRRHLPEDDRNRERQCGQQGGDGGDNWYRGMGECYGANVAYSLYGVLKTDSIVNSISNACVQRTFINSFYTTDGLTSIAKVSTGINVTSIPQTCTSNGNGNNGDSTTLGCLPSGKFEMAEFSGSGCIGTEYLSSLDTLDELNAALSSNIHCKLIYKNGGGVDYATDILSNSMACNNQGNNKNFCPDPYHMIDAYEYNFIMAQQDSTYTVPTYSPLRVRDAILGMLMILAGLVLLAVTIRTWTRALRVRRNKANADATDDADEKVKEMITIRSKSPKRQHHRSSSSLEKVDLPANKGVFI